MLCQLTVKAVPAAESESDGKLIREKLQHFCGITSSCFDLDNDSEDENEIQT